MAPNFDTPEAYLAALTPERQSAMQRLRECLVPNLPEGFEEVMQYGMISYVVSHKLYTAGYHCNPKEPLPFLSIASQKNHIALYHMGLYANQSLLDWFVAAYANAGVGKLDMGKSCIRFKKSNQIPFDLIGILATKMSVDAWIATYEQQLKNK
jgi:hypothetical protein